MTYLPTKTTLVASPLTVLQTKNYNPTVTNSTNSLLPSSSSSHTPIPSPITKTKQTQTATVKTMTKKKTANSSKMYPLNPSLIQTIRIKSKTYPFSIQNKTTKSKMVIKKTDRLKTMINLMTSQSTMTTTMMKRCQTTTITIVKYNFYKKIDKEVVDSIFGVLLVI